MTLSPAKSQKAEERPISFILDARGGAADEVTLFIRPEDMTRTHPSRTSVNQTIGGAWIDSFGEGLESTTISGTLGWRTGPDGLDGAERLADMREKTYHRWHELRQGAVDRGEDPNDIKLRFVDVLNDYSTIIVPLTFEIRRSKSRPLLASYRMSFISVGKAGAAGTISGLFGGFDSAFGILSEGRQSMGLDSLFGSISEINSAINTARNFVDKTILAPVQNFLKLSTRVFTSVHDTIKNGLSLAEPFIHVANSIAQTGLNVFRTLASVASIPSLVKGQLMNVAGAFSNIFCVLKNALKKSSDYEDYSSLYGASNCSSTGGGRPASFYSDQNPFFAFSSASSSGIGVSSGASAALKELSSRDIVLSPPQLSYIGANLADVNAGVSVA